MSELKLMSRNEYDEWVKTLDPSVCTFCDLSQQIVLKEFDQWVWIANRAPYWKYHTMIIPRRHFEKYSEMSVMEAGELVRAVEYGEKRILDAKLLRDDGSLIEKVVYFWRYRMNKFDPKTGTMRPSHFHIHLCSDRDRLWDPIVDDEACVWDTRILS